MTNDEMKKKIANIIDNVFENRCRKTNCQNCDLYPDEMCQPNMYADALIAAGIGDVKEAEHRAKFSERVLNCLARSFAEAMCKYGDDPHYLVDGFIQDAYSQAEKELAEGKMTDEQIVKGLRCWAGKIVKDEECAECAFGEDCSLGEIVDAAENRINELAAENAALRERLDKAVELPFHPDDYHIELDFARLVVSTRIQGCKIAIPIYAYINCEDKNSAEACLAELKGGEK